MLINCPNTNQSMYAFIKNSNLDTKAPKVVYFDRTYTFERIIKEVDAVASYLHAHGVKKGDSIIICLPNIPQAVVALYAINKIGAIANIVHPKIGTKALIKIIHETATEWVFLYSSVINEHGFTLRREGVNIINCRIGQYMQGIKKIIVTGTELGSTIKSTLDFRKLLHHPIDNIDIPINGTDVAIYLHSSGTTGESKTVQLSNYALNELAGVACNYAAGTNGFMPGDSSVMLLPLFHGFGLGVCVHYIMFAGCNILLPSFDENKTVKILQKYKPAFLACVPSMLRRIYKTPRFKGEHLRGLKTVFVGGDKLDNQLREEVESVFAEYESSARLFEGFGLSEVSSVSHVNCLHICDGTVGQPMPNVKQKIMRADGTEADLFEEGEIYIASTSMMKGYLNHETKFVTDKDGTVWFPTGDFGYIGEHNSLYYRGRLKRLIKIGGVNIFPQEVETVASDMKEIDSACAVRTQQNGKPCLRLLVVLKPGYRLNFILKNKIKDTIKSNILPYAVPKEILAVDKIQLNSMGKCDYRYYEEKEK